MGRYLQHISIISRELATLSGFDGVDDCPCFSGTYYSTIHGNITSVHSFGRYEAAINRRSDGYIWAQRRWVIQRGIVPLPKECLIVLCEKISSKTELIPNIVEYVVPR